MTNLQKELGEIVYKYRAGFFGDSHSNSRKMILNGQLWFASSESFNDPYDCNVPPNLIFTDEFILNEAFEHYKMINPNGSIEDAKEFAYKTLRNGLYKSPEHIKKMFDNARKQVGVFCTSQTWDNILMWAHYADSNKGFCAGFDSQVLLDLAKVQVTKIHYSNDPVDRRGTIKNMLNTDLGKLMFHYYHKANIWEYEKEIRYLTVSGAGKLISIPKDQLNSLLKEFIFGWKFKENEIELAVKQIRQVAPSTQFYKIKPSETSVSLERVPLNIK